MNRDGIIYKSLRWLYHKTPMYKKNNFVVSYNALNKEEFLEKISNYDVISFDIFDTLLTRCVYEPDDLFKMMSEKLNDEKFIEKRKNAEHIANEKIKKDVNLDQIYDAYKELYDLSSKEANEIKKLESSLEIDLCVPRHDMLEVFNTLIKEKKYVILTSDMYLNKETIEKMLAKCGYSNYKKFFLSNDINKRKDRKDIWPYLLKKYKNKSIIHIGDNNNSDYLFPQEFGIDSFKIESSKELFKRTSLFSTLNYYIENRTISNSIYLGLLINKTLFNSPFSNLKLENLDDFSYLFHGPIINEYMKFVCENTEEDSNLLFLAREGYYLQKIYKYYISKYKLAERKNYYFLTSRKSTTLASVTTENDLNKIVNNEYTGTIKNFFKKNLEMDIEEDYEISLPDDKEKVLDLIIKHKDSILKEAEEQRINYKKYINSIIPNYKNEKINLIDLGYSGSIQYNLTKMMNKEVTGIYVTNSDKIKKYHKNSKLLFCFDNQKNPNYLSLFHYSLILEYFLTAPYGQLQKFDNNIKPVYNDEKLDSNKKESMSIIYKNVKNYINDVASISKYYKLCYNRDLMCEVYKYMIESNLLTRNVKDKFNFIDSFCRDEEQNIFKIISKY